MKLSNFGNQLSRSAGIVDLMEDLGEALNVNPDLLFLGGGNPAHIPAFENLIAEHLGAIARDPQKLHKLVGIYQSPRGSEELICELVKYFNNQCGWCVRPENIAITNGSQSAFFSLINMFAGLIDTEPKGARQEVVFPLMPEYLGYSDQGVHEGIFKGFKPQIQFLDEHRFKYQVDFDGIELSNQTAAMCVSRPTNPTGNMITADEISRLSTLAASRDIPLIVDCAYGNPFPGVVYDQVETLWNEQNIWVMSLSKLGLPGARTGIVVANEDIIQRLVNINTVMNLANGNFGPALMTELLKQGQLPSIRDDILLPFYRGRRDFIVSAIDRHFTGLDYAVHKPEGAFFVWIWFKDLPITSTDLYERLKEQGVLIMDGSHFFFGVDQSWPHARECVRLNYCQSEDVIDSALRQMAALIRDL